MKKTVRIKSARYTVGIGYVTVPAKTNINAYIETCYRTGMVAMITEDNEFLLNVKVDRWSLQLIDFPDENMQLGSCVVFINQYVSNTPIIIAVLDKNDEESGLARNLFRLAKITETGSVIITGDGNKGNFFIDIDSSLKDGGNVYMNVSNVNKESQVNVNVKGIINIENEGKVNIFSTQELNIKVQDIKNNGFENIFKIEEKGDLTGQFKKMNLGNGDYSIFDLLNDTIDEIAISTVATSLGNMPLLNSATILALKEKVAQILK